MSRRRNSKFAFTLAEALVAITLVALAGSAILLSIDTSTSAVDDAIAESLAVNIGNALIEEALSKPYLEPGVTSLPTTFSPDNGESTNPPQTSLFDDFDDYHNYSSLYAIRDPWAKNVGTGNGMGGERHPNFQLPSTYFQRWSVVLTQTYVDTDLQTPVPAGQVGNYRRIQANVFFYSPSTGWAVLAQPSRVVSYVKPPS